ncbi:glycoside hydrolase family 3 C-terminal domain-containing protein [Clostridium lacusfryxellense]|nr:glycoside hydrolase family 3 C-terminal domain-containing protein [Clostridium lacusfryxellense]
MKQLLHQSVAANEAEAAEMAFNAGVDMEMASSCYKKHIKKLIKTGKIDIERVEDAVKRILTIKFKLGLFEKPYTDINLAKDVMLKPEHLVCARRLASRSMVLLKNNKVLPLSSCGIKIAVIGPMAKERKAMNGSWCLDGSIDRVVTVEEGMRTIASEVEIITSLGALTDNMIYEARKADIIVLY